jgi:hypothetical protein
MSLSNKKILGFQGSELVGLNGKTWLDNRPVYDAVL